eukprot:13518788-Ditylum_brightwellii.AAC.1
MGDKINVRLEPPQVSTLHPAVHPLNVAVYSKDGILGIDFTISSVPPLTKQPHNQLKHMSTLHNHKEVEKWHGDTKQYIILEQG